MANRYDNVVYFNLLTDPEFTEDDYYDADHLNEHGAKKFTLKIYSLIHKAALSEKAQ